MTSRAGLFRDDGGLLRAAAAVLKQSAETAQFLEMALHTTTSTATSTTTSTTTGTTTRAPPSTRPGAAPSLPTPPLLIEPPPAVAGADRVVEPRAPLVAPRREQRPPPATAEEMRSPLREGRPMRRLPAWARRTARLVQMRADRHLVGEGADRESRPDRRGPNRLIVCKPVTHRSESPCERTSSVPRSGSGTAASSSHAPTRSRSACGRTSRSKHARLDCGDAPPMLAS